MNKHLVFSRLRDIKYNQNDDEVAHGLEDALYWEILDAIANGKCDDIQEVCKLALTSKEINFSRWYA